MQAGALATALAVMGSARAVAFCDRNAIAAFIRLADPAPHSELLSPALAAML